VVVVCWFSSEVGLKWETKEKKKTEKRENKGGQECNQSSGFLKKGKAESENCNKMEMRSNHEKGVYVWRDTTREKRRIKTGEEWNRGHGGKKKN